MSHVCPWYMAYLFDHRLRAVVQNPRRILAPYVREGMRALDIGCGMGFFAIEMAAMVGPNGRVVALDRQAPGLKVLRRRAARRGLDGRIETVARTAEDFGDVGRLDVATAVFAAHEVSDPRRMMENLVAALNPQGRFILIEPKVHVPGRQFDELVAAAEDAGLRALERPRVLMCRAVCFGLG